MPSRRFIILAAICRVIVGVTFIFSGFVKAVDPWGTALKVNEYLSIYGIEELQPAAMIFSIWLCGAELMMGCMLTFRVRTRLISIFALLSMTFFTILTFLSATWIPVEDCGCFGDALKLTPWQTFFKNLIILPLVVIVWMRHRHQRILDFSRLEVALTCLFCTFAMGLGAYCYYNLPLIDFLPYKVGVNISEEMAQSALETHEDDVVIANDTKVFPARLYAQKEKTLANIEVFLLRELQHENRYWDVLVDPARKIRIGNKLFFDEDAALIPDYCRNADDTLVVYTPAIPQEHSGLNYFINNGFG